MHALALAPGFFYRLGLDVAIYELPYHGLRSGGARVSPFPGLDLALTNEGVAQTIYELRAIRSWLQQDGGKPVGVVGMSLGGYLAALWASLDPLSFAIAIVPLVSMGQVALDVLDSGQATGMVLRGALAGVSVDELVNAYDVHSPLSLPPVVEPRRRLLMAAENDSVIPPRDVHLLGHHWPGSSTHWFPGDHFDVYAGEGQAARRIHDFLLSLGLSRYEPLDLDNWCAEAA